MPWYGLSAVNESPSGGEPNAVWADNIKYLNLMSAEDFGATIEAYTYPDEFEACNGCAEIAPGVTIAQQDRKMFGFCYRTLIGNDTVVRTMATSSIWCTVRRLLPLRRTTRP